MEARRLHAVIIAACLSSLGASHRTENFIVTAPSEAFSRQVAEAAESYRRELAEEWLGEELPPWGDPCPISVQVGGGAGGATSFMFEGRRPFGWTMTIQGSPTRILDSVLPHEITHTIFATHFGRPLPRWADEGACTTVEHDSEKNKQKQMLIQFLTSGRGIAFNHLFAMKEYPPDVMPLYAQGYSLARYLIAQGGKRQFVGYVGDGMNSSDWTTATQKHYGFKNLSVLQTKWLDWVRTGSPPLPMQVASATSVRPGNSISTTQDEVAAQDPQTMLASTPVQPVSNGGWYARTRDATRATQTPAQATKGSSANARSAIASTRAIGRSVTRQQPPGRPRQTVLEWTNPRRKDPRSAVVWPAPTALRNRLIARDAIWR